MAHHFGARVPTLGVAFLVMFPILYTDTTDAWRLVDKRKRLLIDGGGMIVEIIIACLSLCLWAFLPDGPLRSLAFFAATTSWAFSLLVNLNPCMRFDGYYLISDMLNVQNLQKTGFSAGRWKMREILFKLGAPKPIPDDGGRLLGLLTYAYTTWVYRFFLFIGIALLVHHLFPKAIGIILFSIEIIFFIIRPIWAELKTWWSLRMDILSQKPARKRSRVTVLTALLIIATLIWPWQRHIDAPARLEPSQRADVFPPMTAKIETIHVHNDMTVRKGDILFSLSSDALQFDMAQSHANLALLEAQMARRSANMDERRNGATLDSEYRREQAHFGGLMAQKEKLEITAPQDGVISGMTRHIHEGRPIAITDILARLSAPKQITLIALAPEQDAEKIKNGAALRFIADDPALPTLHAAITSRAPTARPHINEAELTSIYGGRLAVHPETNDGIIPVNPVYEILADIDTHKALNEDYKGRTIRGLAKIKGPREAYAVRISRQIWRVLIREGDF